MVAEGTHDELLATDARYRQVLAAAAGQEAAAVPEADGADADARGGGR